MREQIANKLVRGGDKWLTLLLLALALFLVTVALFEKRTIVKAFTAAWVLFP